MTASSASVVPVRLAEDDIPRVVELLESDFGAAADRTAPDHQALLDGLDRGEHDRFLVWPPREPRGVLYVAPTGALLPAGEADAGPALAVAADDSDWRILVGAARICEPLLAAYPRSMFRRRPTWREQRFMVALPSTPRPDPEGFRAGRLPDLEVVTEFACNLHVEDRMGAPISRSNRPAVRARMLESIAAGCTWVIERDGAVVAKVDVALRSARRGAQIAGVYVAPDHRGQGIGGAAVGAVTARLLAQGLPDVTLHVRVDNTPAIRAYERAGYVDRSAWTLGFR